METRDEMTVMNCHALRRNYSRRELGNFRGRSKRFFGILRSLLNFRIIYERNVCISLFQIRRGKFKFNSFSRRGSAR